MPDSPDTQVAASPAAPSAMAADADLARWRADIEAIDRQLVALLAERMRLARSVGGAKRAARVPIVDPVREAAVVRRAGALARDAGLPDEDVRRIFWQVIELARRTQLEDAPMTD